MEKGRRRNGWVVFGAAAALAGAACGGAPAAGGAAAEPAAGGAAAEPAAGSPGGVAPAAGCLLEPFLAAAGPDRHFDCADWLGLFTIAEVDPAACSASGSVYQGPAMQTDPVAFDLRDGTAALRVGSVPEEAIADPIAVDAEGFSVAGHRCRAMTTAEFEAEWDRQEQQPTYDEEGEGGVE